MPDAPELKQILVIEDDDQTAQWMRFMLEKDGWTVRHAASGEAARAMIGRDKAPWLVTLDVGLPDVSGNELILHLKDAWPRVPIVMVTATPKDENLNWAVERGSKAYLVKPFKPEELQDCVRKFARKPA